MLEMDQVLVLELMSPELKKYIKYFLFLSIFSNENALLFP